ncbi:MAG: Mur ligase family protein, partial [Caulobacteraceae bacterium]
MSEPLWTSQEIADAVGAAVSGSPFVVSGLNIDTRALAPGDLFIALTGERDGNAFAEGAFKADASGALVSRPVEGGAYIQVQDTLAALERLGVAARDRAPAKRIAVTGSVGKTSVTQAISAALMLAGPSHAPVKSFNNHIGMPLTLARMPRDTEFAVFEIGM